MTGFAEFERAGWAEKAAGYDRLLGRVTARVVGDLLDVGCGAGDACAAAAARGAVPTGVDLAPAMIALAPRSFKGKGTACARRSAPGSTGA